MQKPVNIQDVFNPIRFADGIETLHWGALIKRLDLPPGDPNSLNLNPDYQRDYVWTDEQASLFVGHMLSGGVTGYIIVQRHPVPRSGPTIPDEVIDGQQRLRSVHRWMKGEIPATLTDGSSFFVYDLDEGSSRNIRGVWITGPRFDIGYVTLSRADRLRLYLRLNQGGTVHTDADLARVQGMLEKEVSAPVLRP